MEGKENLDQNGKVINGLDDYGPWTLVTNNRSVRGRTDVYIIHNSNYKGSNSRINEYMGSLIMPMELSKQIASSNARGHSTTQWEKIN